MYDMAHLFRLFDWLQDFYLIHKIQNTMFDHIPKTEKRVDNKTHSSVFWSNFMVFGNVVKHALSV